MSHTYNNIQTSIQIAQQITNTIIEKVCQSIKMTTDEVKIAHKDNENINNVEGKMGEKNSISLLYLTSVNNEETKISLPKTLKSRKKLTKIEQQKQLASKARKFVNQLRSQRNQLQGKFHLLKRAQAQKKQLIEKKQWLQAQIKKQVQRNIRRIKAERNIEFYNEKRMVEMRLSNSYSPKKRRLSSLSQQSSVETRIRLPSIYSPSALQQIKEEVPDNIPIGLKKTVRKANKKCYTQIATKHSQDQLQSQARELKLFKQTKNENEANSQRRNRSLTYQYNHDPAQKKYYIMKRKQKQKKDLEIYLEKYTNVSEFISSKNNWSLQKTTNRKCIKDKYQKKPLIRSSLGNDEFGKNSSLSIEYPDRQ